MEHVDGRRWLTGAEGGWWGRKKRVMERRETYLQANGSAPAREGLPSLSIMDLKMELPFAKGIII
jgi:hypothetical protein